MRLLDLFSGAGGAAMGYFHAGFEVVGIDLQPQCHYPFEFIQADALEYLAEHGHEYDAIHASPPCQGYSVMNNLPWLSGREYPLLILPLREMLEGIGKPYVIENVMGARYGAKGLTKRGLESHGLQAGWLCGTMFGLPFYRHRLFAANWFWLQPGHPKHIEKLRPRSQYWRKGERPGHVDFSLGQWQARHREEGSRLATVVGTRQYTRKNGKVETVTRTGTTEPGYGLTQWQNQHPGDGVGIDHAKGWRLAAEAMGIDWMSRDELTQAIPPCYTEYVGRALMETMVRA